MAFDMEEQFSEECVDSGIHEECGVFGAYDFDGNDIASTVYYGLLLCSTEDRKAVVLQFRIPTVLRRTFRFIKEWALSTKCLTVRTLKS